MSSTTSRNNVATSLKTSNVILRPVGQSSLLSSFLTIKERKKKELNAYHCLFREHPRKNPIVKEYILPDYSANRPGRVRTPNEPLQESWQILHMENERFSVPEVLFRPDDIGPYTHLLSSINTAQSQMTCVNRSGPVRASQYDSLLHLTSPRGSSRNVLGEHRSDWWIDQVPWLPGPIVSLISLLTLYPFFITIIISISIYLYVLFY